MAERKQSFRFRMPWGSSGGQASAPKPPQVVPKPPQAAPRPAPAQASPIGETAQSRAGTGRQVPSLKPPPAQAPPPPSPAKATVRSGAGTTSYQSPSLSPSGGPKQSREAPPQAGATTTPPSPALTAPEAQLQPQPPIPVEGSRTITQKDPPPPPEPFQPRESEELQPERSQTEPEEDMANENAVRKSKRSPESPTCPEPEKPDPAIATAESEPEDSVQEKKIGQDPKEKEKSNGVVIVEKHQEKETGRKTPQQREIRDGISNLVHKSTAQQPRLNPEDNPNPVSVITLAGENRGASMQVASRSSEQGEEIKIYRGYRTHKAENTAEDWGQERNVEAEKLEDPPTKAYININVQGSNNSIMLNSSISEGDPGVQLYLTRNQGKTTEERGKRERMEAKKAEFSTTPVEKLTYEPVVRRRCLRGLMMEPSDSDQDNPDKPRRHGCKAACWGTGKDNDNGV